MSEFTIPRIAPRRLVAATLVVVAVALAFWLFYRFHQVVLIFFAAVVISTAIQPVAGRLNRRGIPPSISVVSVYLLMLVLLAGVLWALAPLALTQATRLAATLPDQYAALRNALLSHNSFFVWRLGLALPQQLQTVGLMPMQENGILTTINQGLDAGGQFLKALFNVAVLLALTFYWTLDGKRTIRSLLLWLPVTWRESTREFVEEAENRVSAFVTGQALLCLSIGIMAFIAYLLLDLPYALGLAAVAGLMELIPLFGPIIGAVPAVLVAYSVDPTKAVWVIVATLVMQQVENSVLLPRIMNRSVGVHPLITLLSILAFGLLFGVMGALVAIPIAAVLQLVFERSVIAEEVTPHGRDQVSVLRYEVQDLVQDIRKQIRFKEADANPESDELEDLLETIAADLDQLLAMNRTQPSVSNQTGGVS